VTQKDSKEEQHTGNNFHRCEFECEMTLTSLASVGSTAGIGREYAEHLAQKGMSILIISRSENKLIEQKKEIAEVRYLAYDYTDMGKARDEFYQKFNECKLMDQNGGVGILINNVGIANQYPQRLMELTDKECSDMINCNIDSTIFMTRSVLKFMEPKDRGAMINVSSGSGNLQPSTTLPLAPDSPQIRYRYHSPLAIRQVIYYASRERKVSSPWR
jgi:short-subunit dehydrogenase